MYQIAQCSHCPCQYKVEVDLAQLARKASRWACPVCGGITDFAEYQIQQPNVSPEAKQLWAAVGIGAFLVGLWMFFDGLDGWT